MKWVFDIEATDLLRSSSLDYSQSPYKLKPDYKVHCVVFRNVDTSEVVAFYEGPKLLIEVEHRHLHFKELAPFIEEAVTQLVGHNIINFDLLAVELYFGIPYEMTPCYKVNNKLVDIVDTLIMSRLLNPDRFGGHSLDAWGRRVGKAKIEFGGEDKDSAFKTFTPEMLTYCIRDTEVNLLAYKKMLAEEWGNWSWADAFKLEQQVEHIKTLQEHVGFEFNREKALECLHELNKFLSDIEAEVEPLLPRKAIGKTAAKDFIPPKLQFKQDGSLSAHMVRFIEKHGGTYLGCAPAEHQADVVANLGDVHRVELLGEVLTLPLAAGEPILNTEPMKLAHQEDMKLYLLSLGWEPLVWKEKDLTLGANKRKLSKEKFEETVDRYLENTLGYEWERHRLEHLKVSKEAVREKLLKHKMDKPLKVLTTPSYTINPEKDIDPALIALGAKVAWVEKVVLWLTYRHRRNAIFSEENDTKRKATGWLANPRLDIDGRIGTPAFALGTPTGRMQHIDVANVPRTTSMYGQQLRSLFSVQKGHYQIGYDADGLEARIEGHYVHSYEGGKDYAEMLLLPKPMDVHTQTRDKIRVIANLPDFQRDAAKAVRYGCSYGAQGAKLAKMLGVPLEVGQTVFDAFWEASKPLAILKERVVKFWQDKGKKEYVVGIDGRKIMTRSKHSLLNSLFQSGGVICMKRAMVILFEQLLEEDLFIHPFRENIYGKKGTFQMIAYHDESQNSVHRDLVKFKVFSTEDEAKSFKKSFEESTGKLMSDVGHAGAKFFVAYSRVGELCARSVTLGGEYYNLRVQLTAGYQVGDSWATTH
jgi:hypothetical protein